MKYWINTISRDHVMRGKTGGFTQANHGKATGLKRLTKHDRIVFYSPKTAYMGGESLQAFTAIGTIVDDTVYQVEVTAEFAPWRRKVKFVAAEEALIRPLIAELGFISDKTHWGYKFRFGLFEISEDDFELIRKAMYVRTSKLHDI